MYFCQICHTKQCHRHPVPTLWLRCIAILEFSQSLKYTRNAWALRDVLYTYLVYHKLLVEHLEHFTTLQIAHLESSNLATLYPKDFLRRNSSYPKNNSLSKPSNTEEQCKRCAFGGVNQKELTGQSSTRRGMLETCQRMICAFHVSSKLFRGFSYFGRCRGSFVCSLLESPSLQAGCKGGVLPLCLGACDVCDRSNKMNRSGCLTAAGVA